jgi:NADH:ubiquinone oxidoreductase subunit 2 (subunit N)
MFTLLSLKFFDYIIIWFFIEITNFLFICLINLNLKNKKIIFFYFIIQILASFPIIFSIILNNIFIWNNYINFIIIFALLIKLSIPPFHLWLPIISKYLSWNILFILLTLQKIIPFYIISLIKIHNLIIYLILIACSVIPPYIIFNLYNFKILLRYSSINQSRWIIILISLKSLIWFKYFLFYSIILFILFIFISLYKILINFKYLLINFNKYNNLLIIFIIANMARIPPFSFFYIKWYRIFIFIQNSNLFFIFIIIIIRSLIILFIYINIIINSIFFYKFESKLQPLKFILNNNLNFLIQLSLLLSLIILII